MKLLFLVVLATGVAVGQTQPSGAKALFFSQKSGEETPISSVPLKGTTQRAHRAVGLNYYIELRQPDGSLRKVNVKHVFHSGDRIRLHVQSDVDGTLVIYQKQAGIPEERLFPDNDIPDASGQVIRYKDVVLPSTHAWFQFDDRPGQIELTILLTAALDEDQGPTESQAPASAAVVHRAVEERKGSKALRIEDDPVDNSEYAVMDNRAASIPLNGIATEVMLSHVR